jgi:hypothetical protein
VLLDLFVGVRAESLLTVGILRGGWDGGLYGGTTGDATGEAVDLGGTGMDGIVGVTDVIPVGWLTGPGDGRIFDGVDGIGGNPLNKFDKLDLPSIFSRGWRRFKIRTPLILI